MEKQNQPSLQEYLLNQKVDILAHKGALTFNEESLHQAALAWETNEAGIRAVIDARLDKVRERLILSATPYEVLPLREALAELAHIYEDFEMCKEEKARRAAQKAEVGEEIPEPIAEESLEEESSVT